MIFIPNNVPSLKNSKVITSIGKGENRRPILLPSKTVKKYLKSMGIKKYSLKTGVEEYPTMPNIFRDSVGDYFQGCPVPAVVRIHFVRDSMRKFDFHNAVHIIADLLVAHGFLEDDNMDFFIPVPMLSDGHWYSVDKKRPGVWLKIVEAV